jgi:hypothetical protein
MDRIDMPRSYFEYYGGDEMAFPCDYCGTPVVFIEWVNGVQDQEGGEGFIDKNESINCPDHPDAEDWEKELEPTRHTVKEQL